MIDWNDIDIKKERLDSCRPFPKNTLNSLREKIGLEWTYNTNAIEGNTLTLKETKVVLEGVTIGGKSILEHLEAINHNEAIQYLEDIVEKEESLSEWQIKNLHAIILKKIDSDNAGVYRRENVVISGAEHVPPDHKIVPDQMQQLIADYENKWQSIHPAERASLIHLEFVRIHPFVDGNGRTARLLQNFELMKHGFPPIIIKKEQRLDYYNYLDKSHTKGENEEFFIFWKVS